MPQRSLFRVLTPLGYFVVLTRNRWREITRYKHPAVKSEQDNVQECLERPDIIRESAKDSDVHLYYLQLGDKYLCVVVSSPPADSDRFVISVYFTKRIKAGNELWTK